MGTKKLMLEQEEAVQRSKLNDFKTQLDSVKAESDSMITEMKKKMNALQEEKNKLGGEITSQTKNIAALEKKTKIVSKMVDQTQEALDDLKDDGSESETTESESDESETTEIASTEGEVEPGCTKKGFMPCGTGLFGKPIEKTFGGVKHCCPAPKSPEKVKEQALPAGNTCVKKKTVQRRLLQGNESRQAFYPVSYPCKERKSPNVCHISSGCQRKVKQLLVVRG